MEKQGLWFKQAHILNVWMMKITLKKRFVAKVLCTLVSCQVGSLWTLTRALTQETHFPDEVFDQQTLIFFVSVDQRCYCSCFVNYIFMQWSWGITNYFAYLSDIYNNMLLAGPCRKVKGTNGRQKTLWGFPCLLHLLFWFHESNYRNFWNNERWKPWIK